MKVKKFLHFFLEKLQRTFLARLSKKLARKLLQNDRDQKYFFFCQKFVFFLRDFVNNFLLLERNSRVLTYISLMTSKSRIYDRFCSRGLPCKGPHSCCVLVVEVLSRGSRNHGIHSRRSCSRGSRSCSSHSRGSQIRGFYG